MKIRRDNLFRYFENTLGSSFYVGLHGISDDPDFINEFSNLSNDEKAKNIMRIGLINSRKKSIKSNCRIFGRLSDTYENNKKIILDFNKFKAYKCDGKQYIVVVAIPILFLHSDGRVLFGGWMNPEVLYNDDTSPFECISDKLCKDLIYPEFILGYYSYDNDIVDFIPNNRFYGNLSIDEKDSFIDKLFDGKHCSIDLCKGMDNCKRLLNESRNRGFFDQIGYDIVDNLLVELENDFSYNDDVLIKSESYNNDIDGVSIDKINPSFELVFYSKYNIKEDAINNRINGNNLCDLVGFYQTTKIDREQYVDSLIFEEWIKTCGNDVNVLYNQYYQMNYKELNEMFINNLKKLNNVTK